MRRGNGVDGPRCVAAAVVALALMVPVVADEQAAAAGRGGDLAAWVEPATLRVSVGSRPRPSPAAVIEAARGETESFQVVTRAVGGPLTGVVARVSPLQRADGATIGGARITLFREHYVRVSRHSPAGSGPRIRWRWFPDALIPFVDPVTGRPPRAGARYVASPYAVRAGRNQPVWVDVTVPYDAGPGTYTGAWSVSARSGGRTVTRSGTVTLRVRTFALPVAPASGSRFSIRRPANRIAAVEDLLLRYRVQPSPATVSREGVLRRRGFASVDLRYWSGADVDTCRMAAPPTVDELRSATAGHLPGLAVYDYSADEVSACPDLTDDLVAWARSLHEAGIDHLVTVRPRADLMDDGTGRPVVDIWTMLPYQLRRLDPEVQARILAAGGRFWSYQALVQGRRTPSWQLDFPVTHYRVLGGFLNASQGVTGLLYWGVDQWQRDPWTDPTYRYTDSCCYPGDGTLVYPGSPAGVVGVVPSIRLAMVRDGMDDYDYVALLRAQGRGAEAAAALTPAAQSWSSWTSDGRVLAAVRHHLGDLLEGI